MNKYLSKETYIIFCIMLLFFSIFIQIAIIPKLPQKYFYDSNNILVITNSAGRIKSFDKSFNFTGKFFKKINFFKIKSFKGWAYIITIIMSIVNIVYLIKLKQIKLHQTVFLTITMFFLNIFIYRISKDFIQMLFWDIIYFINLMNIRDKYKIVLIFVLFFIESIYFRSYYIVTGILFLALYLFFKLDYKKNLKYSKIFSLLALGILISLVILNKFFPKEYNMILNMRESLNGARENSTDAVTQINNLISGKSPIVYMINYLINLIRFLIPIELIFKGIKYLPFIIYQLYFVFELMILIKDKTIRNKNIILISIVIAYILTANLYEPDFGSIIRHEVALYFIILYLLFYSQKEEGEEEKYEN